MTRTRLMPLYVCKDRDVISNIIDCEEIPIRTKLGQLATSY